MLVDPGSICTPPKEDAVLWRYMDFTKFMRILETRQFAFTRSDLFDDPFEGYWSAAGVRQAKAEIAAIPNLREGDDAAFQKLLLKPEYNRKRMYVSCWCSNSHESAALWQLYLSSKEGIAIRTDWGRVRRILDRSPPRIRTTMVNYVDYETHLIPFNNIFSPFVFKRMSFSHEAEFRALMWAGDIANKRLCRHLGPSIGFDIDLNELVESIYVSPTAPKWFGDLVGMILRRYKLDAPLITSGLYDRPTY